MVNRVRRVFSRRPRHRRRAARTPINAGRDRVTARESSVAARVAGDMADRALLALMKSPSRYPKLADFQRVQAEVHSAHRYFTELGLLAQPARFHRTPPPLNQVEVRERWYPRLHFEGLSFASGYQPLDDDISRSRWLSYAQNHVGHAWVLRHPGGPRPWLICLHGMGTGSPAADFPAFRALHLHRKLGLNLVFPVLPLHGPRQSPELLRGSLLSYDLLNTVHGMSQAIWDVRRIIGWVRRQNPTRVGLYGMSLGAFTASLVAAYEDVDLVIAGIPVCDVPSLFRAHASDQHLDMAHRHDVLGHRVDELYRIISPKELKPKPERERRFILAGTEDRVSTPAQAELLWEAWDHPALEWFPGGHMSFFWSQAASRYLDRILYEMEFRHRRR